MKSVLFRQVSRILIVSTLGMCLPFSPAQAKMVSTGEVAAPAQTRADSIESAQTHTTEQQRDHIRAMLAREDVQSGLLKQGVDPAAVKSRVDALTDDEVRQVSGKLDQAPAGGDIIGVLLTIFIVLLVTDILGFTKVFSFTRPIR
jgi:hypothetical protein